MGSVAWAPNHQCWFNYCCCQMSHLPAIETNAESLIQHYLLKRSTCYLAGLLQWIPSTMEGAAIHLDWNCHIFYVGFTFPAHKALASTTIWELTEMTPWEDEVPFSRPANTLFRAQDDQLELFLVLFCPILMGNGQVLQSYPEESMAARGIDLLGIRDWFSPPVSQLDLQKG